MLLCLALACLAPQAVVTDRVSLDSFAGEANARSGLADLDGSGRWMAFESLASNLVGGDQNQVQDIFLRDLVAGVTTRVSVSDLGDEAVDHCFTPSISEDGRFIAFDSRSSNLVPSDTNGAADVFFFDRLNQTLERISVATGGGEGDGDSVDPSVSADGNLIAFSSSATNLAPFDGNSTSDIFVHDRTLGTTVLISWDSNGGPANGPSYRPALAADGGWIAFDSTARDLVSGDLNFMADVFLHELATGQTQRVSLSNSGEEGDWDSNLPEISAAGARVCFRSLATNFVAGDTGSDSDVFVWDRASALLQAVSVDSWGSLGNGSSVMSVLSGDGAVVAFHSSASNLVAGDGNLFADVFVHELASGMTERISISSSADEGNQGAQFPALSRDGRLVAFLSDASNLVTNDWNAVADVFVHDRQTGGPFLSMDQWVGGASSLLTVSGATPFGSVVIVYTLAGQGETPFAWGLLNLAQPLRSLQTFADGAGVVLLDVPIPASLSGAMVWGQAVDLGQKAPSNTIFDIVQ